VVNAGLAGATSAENLSRLIFLVSEVAPDLVVIHHGLSETWTRAYGCPIQSDFSNYRGSDQDRCKFLQSRSAASYSPTSRRSRCTISSEA